MRFSLKRVSASCYAITQGRNKVGTVVACPKGYVARLGTHCEVAASPETAFRAVAAKQLGFQSPEQVADHNRVVRAKNKAARAQAAWAVDRMLGDDFKPIMDLLLKV